MTFLDILLIIISSAGLLHGLAFAVYLCFLKKKKTIANYLLAFILIFMAFRIGKSVMLNFRHDLEPVFIFAGLAFLLIIGPLVRWYVAAMTQVNFKVSSKLLLEVVPFALVFVSSFFVTKNWFDSDNKEVIIVFASMLIFIYLHCAFYIFIAYQGLKNMKKTYPKAKRTKSQKAILSWLSLLLLGFMIIWGSYVLNIIEGAVPYIIGPIMYSIVIYFLSFKAFQLKVTDLDGHVFKENDNRQLFTLLTNRIVEEKLYLESTVSLAQIGTLVNKSSQKTSEVINQYAKQNFNDFINSYRVQEAKKMLVRHQEYTIAAIAFDCGFNSLSSFNTAFKKFEGITPSRYRKRHGV